MKSSPYSMTVTESPYNSHRQTSNLYASPVCVFWILFEYICLWSKKFLKFRLHVLTEYNFELIQFCLKVTSVSDYNQMRLITLSYNEFSSCFIAQPWEGVFAVVVVFYSVLGIRHHVLGIFLAENDLREIIMSFLPLVFILKCV